MSSTKQKVNSGEAKSQQVKKKHYLLEQLHNKYDQYYDKKGPPGLGKRSLNLKETRRGVVVPKTSREQRAKKRGKFHEQLYQDFVSYKTRKMSTNVSSVVQDPIEKN